MRRFFVYSLFSILAFGAWGAVVATFESGESWTGGSGAANTTQYTEGTQSWRVGSTGAFNSSTWTTAKDLSTGQYFQIDVYVEDVTKLDGISVIAEKDVTGSNFARYDHVAADLVNGWNELYWNKADMTHSGTFVSADWSSIARLRVGTDAAAAQTTYCSFDDWQQFQRTAQAIIEIDDGLITVYSLGMPIVESYGFKIGAFLLTTDSQGSGNYETWANIREMRTRGHVIGFHYHTDADYSDNTVTEIRADMDAGIAAAAAEGLRLRHFGSSQGKVDDDIDQVQRERFLTGRRNVYPSDFGDYDLPLSDKYTLWGRMVVNATTLVTFQGWVDTIIEQERGAMFVWHNFDPVADPTNGVDPDDFDDQISYLKTKVDAGELEVITREEYEGGGFLSGGS